jgi:3-hydroxyisobutyrate dehydrogenase
MEVTLHTLEPTHPVGCASEIGWFCARHARVCQRTVTTIAFLGTGTMGLPMARNLSTLDGVELRAWNRSRERAEPLRGAGATVVEDPREAAESAEVIVTMLADAEAVLDTASRALSERAERALTWLQMSTIGLEGTDRCAELASERGVAFVDAPVLGTREPAEQRKLVVLASGPDAELGRCRPLFDALGRTIELGEAGAGTRAKMVVNSWVLGVTGLVAETIGLAEALGVDPQLFFEAVKGGTLDLEYARLKGRLMIERSFEEPAFRLRLARKDADLVLAAARSAGLPTPVLEAVGERLRTAEEEGHGEQDMAANYLAHPVPSAEGSRS